MKRWAALTNIATTSLCLAVAASLSGHTATAADHRPFDPRSDAARVESCMAIYMTLGKATVGLEPKSEMDALQFEMGRGMTRLDPFVDKAAGAIGQDKFYHDAVASRIWEDRILGFPMPNAARSNIAHRVAADAEQCDHQLDEWGAPHMCFAPTANWHVCLGSEPGQHR